MEVRLVFKMANLLFIQKLAGIKGNVSLLVRNIKYFFKLRILIFILSNNHIPLILAIKT